MNKETGPFLFRINDKGFYTKADISCGLTPSGRQRLSTWIEEGATNNLDLSDSSSLMVITRGGLL